MMRSLVAPGLGLDPSQASSIVSTTRKLIARALSCRYLDRLENEKIRRESVVGVLRVLRRRKGNYQN